MGETRTAARNRRNRSRSAPADRNLTGAFANKAGQYELVRIEGNMAYYHFTNHQGHRTDAAMPVLTWRRLQERTEPAAVSAC